MGRDIALIIGQETSELENKCAPDGGYWLKRGVPTSTPRPTKPANIPASNGNSAEYRTFPEHKRNAYIVEK